jgi:hypothetical protein
MPFPSWITKPNRFSSGVAFLGYRMYLLLMADSKPAQEVSSEAIPRWQLDEMPPALAVALRPRVERLGYLGEFFQCAANQPDALLAFVEFTELAKGELSPRIVELVALTMATLADNDYERHQHEQLSETLGFARDWIRAAEGGDPLTPLSADELAVQAYLRSAFPTGIDAADEFAEVTARLGPAHAVAVLLLAARYAAHALVVNTLGLDPPVPSIFAGGRGDS